jgi:hypothetical protein
VIWHSALISTGMHGECEAAFCKACNKIHLRGDADAMSYVRLVWRNSTRESTR